MEKPSFVYVTYIAATPQKLWNALIDSEVTKQYWGNRVNASDWKVGSAWQHRDHDDPKLVDLVGKVVEFTPPKRLVLTWGTPADAANPAKQSRVTLEIEPFPTCCKLTVTHDELEPGSKMLEGITRGWPAVMASLKTLLETGTSMTGSDRRGDWPPH